MKRYLIIAGCVAAAVTACRKEELTEKNIQGSGIGGVTYSLTVENNDWTDDGDGKSSFNGGKIALDGNEPISIFHFDETEDKLVGEFGFGQFSNNANGIKAEGEAFSYSFTAPSDLGDDTQWYAVVPYSRHLVKAVSEENGKPAFTIKIHSVQYPGTGTFDPHYDFLVAKPFKMNGTEGKIEKFKRLVAPFQLVIKGLPEGEKIFTASLQSDRIADKNEHDGLTGIYQWTVSEDGLHADNTDIVGANNVLGNGVTAIYPDGLAADGGVWNVWYCVNPTTLGSGETLTVTLTSAARTYTRDIPLGRDLKILRDNINKLSVNMGGNDVSVTLNTVLFDFSDIEISKNKASSKVSNSNNGPYVLNVASASTLIDPSTYIDKKNSSDYYDGGVGLPKGLMLTDSNGTNKWLEIPTLVGVNIKKIGMYMHHFSSSSNSAKLCIYEDNETDVKEALITGPCGNTSAGYASAGYFEIACPDDRESLSGLYLQGDGTYEFTAMKFFIELTSNDYYDLFNKGNDIVINGVMYNRTTHSNYSNVEMKDVTTSTFSGGEGIIFLDDSGEMKSFNSGGNIAFSEGLVVVGRYRNSQPTLITGTESVYFGSRNNVILKNLHLVSNGAAAFNTSESAEVSITCEDCEIEVEKHLLQESNAGNHFKDVTFNNCIIVNGDTKYGLVGYSTDGKAEIGKEGSITITNSVVMTKPKDNAISYLDRNIIDLTAGTDSVKTVITLKNNSFIGFNGATGGAALVRAKTIGGIDIEKCLFYGNWAVGKTNRLFKTTTAQSWPPSVVKFLDNAAKNATAAMSATNGDTQGFMNLSIPNKDNTGHLWNLKDDMFSAMDCTNFYFPVNRTVVTNGAGADYSTKLWKTWPDPQPTSQMLLF